MARTGTPRESLEGGKMKGGVFKSHLTWLSDNRTPQEREAVMKLLPAEARQALSGSILPSSWFPFAWLVELDRAMMNLFGGGKLEFLEELGRYSARINLSTTYRVFNRDTNHEFFHNSALLHSQFQDFGKAAYEKSGDSSGKMVHTDYSSFSPIFCASAIGYYEGCITSHGAPKASVRETECQCYGDRSCTFEMKW